MCEWKCDDCGKVFKGKFNLERHRAQHDKENPHNISATLIEGRGKTYSRLDKFVEHQRKHNANKVKVPVSTEMSQKEICPTETKLC